MTHWLIISIISAATWGIVSVLDKRILNSYIVSPIIYFSWIGLISILYSIILFIFIPFTSSYTIEFLWPLFAGMIWGIGIIILFQALIHLGVNIRLFPTTGMTLPFLSYGGSSIIGTAILSGIILNLTKRRITF